LFGCINSSQGNPIFSLGKNFRSNGKINIMTYSDSIYIIDSNQLKKKDLKNKKMITRIYKSK
jgi:hypothetical protein